MIELAGKAYRVVYSELGPFMNCEPDMQKAKAVARVRFVGIEPI